MKRVNLFMNILPEVGLYNGAIGTVVEIVYKNRPEGPNDKEHYHLPDYVVVDFPNLKLPDGIPPWDQNHKTVSLTFSSLLSLQADRGCAAGAFFCGGGEGAFGQIRL